MILVNVFFTGLTRMQMKTIKISSSLELSLFLIKKERVKLLKLFTRGRSKTLIIDTVPKYTKMCSIVG